jgi:hypothetical protein
MIQQALCVSIMLYSFHGITVYADETSVKNNNPSPESDQELLDELLGIVEDSTAIATETRMYANSVSGTIIVLQVKELE